jgi:hypothetical protein
MRIRTIKPEFWLHEGLCGCSDFTRLLAIALLNWADDHGYFMAHPSLLRGSLFPFLDDSKKIPGSLQDLSRVGWIELGTDNQGRPVGRVVNFSKHQRVDKPKESTIKDLCAFQDQSKTRPGIIQDASKEEGNGMEQGIGMERNGGDSPGGDFSLSDSKEPKPSKSKPMNLEEVFEYADTQGIKHGEAEDFWDKMEAKGWKVNRQKIADWRAQMRTYHRSGWLNDKPKAEAPADKYGPINNRWNNQAS